MKTSKVTTGYRITLIKEVREWLGVKQGDFVDVSVTEGGGIRIRKL